MAGVYGKINSRADFQALLDKAIARGSPPREEAGRCDDRRDLRQLEAAAGWTANGRTPTKRSASRSTWRSELARARGDGQAYNWTRDIYALDSYIKDWPSDEKAASATDDDFFDGDGDDDE